MASGIYKLTFSSGKYYIGKSLDLETRWKQHFNKFATGKAARPMQLEYDRCGLPETEVLIYTHKDHIDILEELLIDQEKGPDMLNTTYPQVERTDDIVNLINESKQLLHLSTLEHLSIIRDNDARTFEIKNRAQEAEERVEAYKTRGYLINEDYMELVDKVQEYVDINEDLQQEIHEHKAYLEKLSRLSWWDRLFNYKVYV